MRGFCSSFVFSDVFSGWLSRLPFFFAAAISLPFLGKCSPATGLERRDNGRVPMPVGLKADHTMKKAKFVQDAKNDPSRYYRNPSDVIRDRRLTNEDRLEILAAWERDARQRLAKAEKGGEPEQLEKGRHNREKPEPAAQT